MAFLRNLFSGRRADPPPAPLAPVYAIGDVHGCAERLEQLLDMIAEDKARCDLSDARIVFAGDYVDRGPDSRAVLARVMAMTASGAQDVHCLMGNHEDMLLRFIDNPVEQGRRFLRHGGAETLASFGIAGAIEAVEDAMLVDFAGRFRASLDPGCEAWLRGLPLIWNSGTVFVAHAGLDPRRPPDDQQDHDLLWGAPGFLEVPRRDGIWVAHGHWIVDAPAVSATRISLDTGAWRTGCLTAARILPDGSVAFMTTSPLDARIAANA